MLVACLVASLLFATAQCQYLLAVPHPQQNDNRKLIQCVIRILNEYFIEDHELTYVNINREDEELLKAIYSTMNFSLLTRQPTQQMFIPNLAYLVSTTDVSDFIQYFECLIREPVWNPYARFLIVIRSIQISELRLIFDVLLKLHVNNVLVINGTNDAHLYTYNPFDDYACGKYYNTVISYGLCAKNTENLFPNKLVTELKNCKFSASIRHRPPYAINPSKMKEKKTMLGAEEYILKILGEKLQFDVSFNYNYDGSVFSMVVPNMTAIGSLSRLQNNESDIIFGGQTMVASRAEAFSFLCGYHEYSDELQFVVKAATVVPIWKYIYLEFEFDVWALLFVAFITYSIIAVILLHSEDSGDVVLRLLDNLTLHGREVHTRMSVKCVLITWVWFAYLINTFYQSNLFSFTTHPIMEFQISDEEDLVTYDLQPCFSPALQIFLLTETNQSSKTGYFSAEECSSTEAVMNTVSSNKKAYSMVQNYFYLYNQREFDDMWGNPVVYFFEKPYMKFLFAYVLYKGFPITKSLQLNAMRMRESGLVDKKLRDHYYSQTLKKRIFKETFRPRFLFPWGVYILGVGTATFVFVIELLVKYTKCFKCRSCAIHN